MSLKHGWPFVLIGVALVAAAVALFVTWPLQDPCGSVDIGGPLTPAQAAAYAAACARVRPTSGWLMPGILTACGLLTGGIGLVRPRPSPSRDAT